LPFHAIDVLHDEKRHLVISHPAIEQLRDASVLERREDLSLGEEALAELVGIWTGANQLHRDSLPVLSVVPFSEVHHAHAAATELTKHAIGTDSAAPLNVSERTSGGAGDVSFQHSFRTLVRGDHRIDLGAESLITAAPVGETASTIRGREVDRGLEDRLDFPPNNRVHLIACHGTLGRA